jgi:hypothetical protein
MARWALLFGRALRARLALVALSALVAPAGGGAAAAPPPLTALPRQQVFFAYTRITCDSDSKGVVSCYRRGATGGPATGTNAISLAPDGLVTVYAVGTEARTVPLYKRVLTGPGGEPGWLIALPGQVVRIGSISCVEHVARNGRIVTCGHGSTPSEHAEFDTAGRVSVTSDVSGATIWSSRAQNPVAGPGQIFELTVRKGKIVCQVSVDEPEHVSCDREGPTSPTARSFAFAAYPGGTILIVALENGRLVGQRSFGPKLPIPAGRASPGVTPSTTFLEKGAKFQVGSSQLACVAFGSPEEIGCGLTDAKGYGVPHTYSAVMHGDGSISITRYDRNRKPHPVR